MPARKSAASEPPASRPNAPDYEIVAENAGDGLLPWTWAVRKLSRSRNYFLSTVRRDRRPHIMPIWGVWVENAFYFSTGKRSVKARNLRANPRCVVCPGDAEEAVILEGVARVVRSRPVLKRFARAYLKKYKWNVSKMNEPVYAVRPRVVFGQIEKTFTKSATRWTFPSTALLLAMFAFTNNASACECELSGPPCQNYFHVDVVFAGTVQSRAPNNRRSPSREHLLTDQAARGRRR
jgi:Pyridoxamine 5'-phosphate oxidase